MARWPVSKDAIITTLVDSAVRNRRIMAAVPHLRRVTLSLRTADLGGTKLGPRMGVGVLGPLRIPLLLGSAFLVRAIVQLRIGQLLQRKFSDDCRSYTSSGLSL